MCKKSNRTPLRQYNIYRTVDFQIARIVEKPTKREEIFTIEIIN